MAVYANENVGWQFQLKVNNAGSPIESSPAPTAVLRYGASLANSSLSTNTVTINFQNDVYTARFVVPAGVAVGDTVWLVVSSTDSRLGGSFSSNIVVGQVENFAGEINTFLPITVADIKHHLVLDTTTDDDYLESLILSSQKKLENDARTLLVQQNKTLSSIYINCFAFDYSNVVSINQVQYYNSEGTLITYDNSNYYLDTDSNQLVLQSSATSPAFVNNRNKRPWRISYTAGFANSAGTATLERAKIPQDLIQALRLLVAFYYENRDAVVTGTIATELPLGYQNIVNCYNSNI